MNDLISRCDVLSYILYVQNSGLGKKKALEYIYKYVENAISAYNVDKVVEQLETEMEFAEKEMEECTFKGMPFYDTQKGYATAMYNAIEIVRKGGVE